MKNRFPPSLYFISAALFMLPACAKAAPIAPPTFDPLSINTAIAWTAEAAMTQTVVVISPTVLSVDTPLQPVSTPAAGTTLVSDMDGAILVHVPAGEFLMGSSDVDLLANPNEKPQHPVTLDAFWMDQTEVTNKQYLGCVIAGRCPLPSYSSSHTHPAYYDSAEFENYPVLYVDWNRANAYCSWAGRRLPTEAEWEKAARGTDGRIYPWGNDEPTRDFLNANLNIDFGDLNFGETTPVGSYELGRSFYGAHDMGGNVFEWTSSLLKPYPYDATDGREDMNSSEARVLRGGSFFYPASFARSAFRDGNKPTDNFWHIGFRCASSHP